MLLAQGRERDRSSSRVRHRCRPRGWSAAGRREPGPRSGVERGRDLPHRRTRSSAAVRSAGMGRVAEDCLRCRSARLRAMAPGAWTLGLSPVGRVAGWRRWGTGWASAVCCWGEPGLSQWCVGLRACERYCVLRVRSARPGRRAGGCRCARAAGAAGQAEVGELKGSARIRRRRGRRPAEVAAALRGCAWRAPVIGVVGTGLVRTIRACR